VATQSKKRKAEDEPAVPTKKAKIDTTANGNGASAESSTIFVGKLSWSVDDDWLKSEFDSFGEITRANVVMDRQSGRSKGFGYVEFTTPDAAKKAMEAKNGKEIDGRAVNIDISLPKAPNPAGRAKAFGDSTSPESKVLFVGNVSFEADEDSLWSVFGEYGDVVSVRLVLFLDDVIWYPALIHHIRLPKERDTEQPKGYGYVEFIDIESAKKAFKEANGREIGGRNVRLDYSQPRDNNGGGGGGGRGRGRGGFGDRGGGRGGRGGGRGGFGDRGGGRGGFGDRGRGGGSDRGWGGGRGGNVRTGGAAPFEGKKVVFDP
jgi:nucleolin